MIQVLRWALRLGAALGLGLAIYLLTVAHWAMPNVTVVDWPRDLRDPGGWSGLEVDTTGTQFWAIHDDGGFGKGILLREGDQLIGARLDQIGRLKDARGVSIVPPNHDSEGLDRDPWGRFAVAFEWQHRVWLYETLGGPADPLAPDPRFEPFRGNVGLEAVASDDLGTLLTFRERRNHLHGPTQIYQRRPYRPWSDGPPFPQSRWWSAVGADQGPDGWLYLLERRFRFIGFATRIRRMDLTAPDPAATVQEVYHSPVGRHGNLEGLATWRDGGGRTRLILITDDNRNWFQRSQVIEITLPLASPP